MSSEIEIAETQRLYGMGPAEAGVAKQDRV